MNNLPPKTAAETAAARIRSTLGLGGAPIPIGIILGTGWGDVLALDDYREMDMKTQVPGFETLCELEGHHRKVAYGLLNGVPVVAQRGRVHLNEEPLVSDGDRTRAMVRLQTEMLIKLGVKTIILTCAAGALYREVSPSSAARMAGDRIRVGDICVIDGFVTEFMPRRALTGGEFKSPEDTLDPGLREIALSEAHTGDLRALSGGHVMLRGPAFEGRKYDKPFLASTGATVVGMSVLPEADVVALYPDVKALGLAFVTNDATEEHSHEENQRRAKQAADKLGDYLGRIVSRIASAESK
ncbi:hypothetical protein A3C96_01865 [Candidatus Uhrbacteria bacterium RIFCSPHIGHO2_02_FULL_60_10]|uniref:purine-nucleoside phosphorylase n=1 Tax=Candidatus Uhrbacteria bacterium RIFCSPHIGHO2_02_FULL_60_10 TaxID=1802392 RepID=A0A1F7U8S1_9BACT|nr:MAG: hypothetical protein A3C96_01865 [Candidatus Uhrbacteria bacterium RIFCSPHIGHO2_02_FULL_60_10]